MQSLWPIRRFIFVSRPYAAAIHFVSLEFSLYILMVGKLFLNNADSKILFQLTVAMSRITGVMETGVNKAVNKERLRF